MGFNLDANFNKFINIAILFDEPAFSKLKLGDVKKGQMDLNSKVSNIKIGGKKSDEQFSALKIITNLNNPQDYVLQFFEDYFIIMNNVIYDAWCGKGLKI